MIIFSWCCRRFLNYPIIRNIRVRYKSTWFHPLLFTTTSCSWLSLCWWSAPMEQFSVTWLSHESWEYSLLWFPSILIWWLFLLPTSTSSDVIDVMSLLHHLLGLFSLSDAVSPALSTTEDEVAFFFTLQVIVEWEVVDVTYFLFFFWGTTTSLPSPSLIMSPAARYIKHTSQWTIFVWKVYLH